MRRDQWTPIMLQKPTGLPPNGWEWARLRDVARLESGHTPSRSVDSYWSGEVPWLSLKDIKTLASMYVTETVDHPTMQGIDNSSARILPKGTVALCRTASVGKVAILGRDMATSQDFVNWVCGPKMLPEYLYYAFRYSQAEFDRLKQGTTHKTIYMPVAEEFMVLLPPFSEQQRIATILDKADAIRRKRQQAIDTVSELKDSQFHRWFTPLFESGSEDRFVPVSSFVRRFEGGLNLATPDSPSPETRDFILKVSAVTWGDYRPEECKPLRTDYSPPTEHFVRKGDLLFSRANTTELVGATVYVFETPTNRVLPDKLWRFVWHDASTVEPLFVWALFNHPRVRVEIGRRATGTSGSMKNISMEKVLSMRVPWPDADVRGRFARFLADNRSIQVGMTESASEAKGLFDSLVYRAFRGEL